MGDNGAMGVSGVMGVMGSRKGGRSPEVSLSSIELNVSSFVFV